MLTASGKRLAAVQKSSGGALPNVTVTAQSSAYIEAKSITGTTIYITPSPQNVSNAVLASELVESGSSASSGVAFGSGTATHTENDYTIGNLITGLTVQTTPTTQTIFDSVNNKYVARLEYTISNDTGADVTITEVAMFVRFGTSKTIGGAASTSAADRYAVMVDRTLLTTPVTIPNGSAGTVRYEFAY